MDLIEKLSAWYAAHCNGEWEHRHGVKIDTLDNPGWYVEIDLAETPLAGVSFESVRRGVSEESVPRSADWIDCRVRDDIFCGAGDPARLREILEIFLAWAEQRRSVA